LFTLKTDNESQASELQKSRAEKAALGARLAEAQGKLAGKDASEGTVNKGMCCSCKFPKEYIADNKK
jgi:peptidoglycan hydrolase CwlO-like protein